MEMHSNVIPAYKLVQFRLPVSLAADLDRAAAETTGTASSYLRRALFEQLLRDGFRFKQTNSSE